MSAAREAVLVGTAVAAAGGAAALLLAAPRIGRAGSGSSRLSAARGVAAVGAVLAGGTALARPDLTVAVVCIGLAAAVLVRLLAGVRADRAAAVLRGRVVEACESLRAELVAGQAPPAALERVETEWPFLGPVARAARAGGDVPAGLRGLAGRPGAGDLRVVAAAWQVAHRTGHGLAAALGRVAAELRAAEQTRRVVAGELASARATARLVAALPVAALLIGSGSGADPWTFLLTEPAGLVCLAGGLTCGVAGLAWIEALARGVEQGR